MEEQNAPPRWALPPVRAFLSGLMFLTRVPCPRWVDHDTTWLSRSTAYFPWIGLLVGLLSAGGYLGAAALWPPAIAALVAVAVSVWITGGFHEDGLADTFDGLGSAWSPQQALAVMGDSRLGTYGALALLLVLGARVGALAGLAEQGPWAVGAALVTGHVAGRWSSLPLIRFLPYVASDGSKARPFAASVTTARLLIGSLFTAGFGALALGWAWPTPAGGVAAAGATLLITAAGGIQLKRKLGGMTGDGLGAVNALTETGVHLALLATAAQFG
jgi:adenosylcobinamide-GDP ribazoletransferase